MAIVNFSHFVMDVEYRFKNALLSQAESGLIDHESRLDECCAMAKCFADVQGGIAVVSDLLKDRSYIFSGGLGESLGLKTSTVIESAFEDIIFSLIAPQDLLDRHVLELRYIELIKTLPVEKRGDYTQSSKVNLHVNGEEIPIIHQTRYFEITDSGSVNIGICTYMPIGVCRSEPFEGQIINLKTGKALSLEELGIVDSKILSIREREVLALLSQGMASKQIADKLNISLNTVYRHRQNILQHLNVANTAEAVKIGLKMNLI